ncbi:hypothetical protein [Bariatricus sp. HCP28S3_D3]|uniref:hypothetical protein n=1 Tax=Bariatricus sp. HCP28S3_D3 TaxID=3438901 RepID=UPI003F8A665F
MAEKKVIYFGKVNIISSHVYKMYDSEYDFYDVLLPVLINIKDGLEYEYRFTQMYDEKMVEVSYNYVMRIKEKTDTYVYGYLNKKGRVPYKTESISGELVTEYIDNTERIEFYYDVFKEKIGYYTSIRFGHKEILDVFEHMLNSIFKDEEDAMMFSVSRYTNGLDVKNIEKELQSIGNIQKLKFTFKPINPDTELRESILKNGIERLEEFEDANLSIKHVELYAASRMGLNIESNIVREQIDYANSINSNVSFEKSTGNGYVKVEAVGSDGITHSTEDKAPVKKEINNIIDFKSACQELINKGNS